jgi:hypothetical protein
VCERGWEIIDEIQERFYKGAIKSPTITAKGTAEWEPGRDSSEAGCFVV